MTHTSENIRVATTRVVRLPRCHAVVVTSYRDGVDRYAMWDAAYVLGSLSAADRREFEAHMANCPACWDAVEDLSGLPALLSQLDRQEVAAIDESGPAQSATSAMSA
jgi:anti-sigma-K factor RskA